MVPFQLKQTADESQEIAKHQLQQEDERQQEEASSLNAKDPAKQTASDITVGMDAFLYESLKIDMG